MVHGHCLSSVGVVRSSDTSHILWLQPEDVGEVGG
jgi:hypothetical protein